MLRRYKIGSIVFLAFCDVPQSLPSEFANAKLVFQAKNRLLTPSACEKILVPAEHSFADIFYDDIDEDVYLTNFIMEQSFLDIPVEGVVVFEENVEVFVGSTILSFGKYLMSPSFRTEAFYFNLYGYSSTSVVPRAEHGYREAEDTYDERGSLELGVYTADESFSIEEPEKCIGSMLLESEPALSAEMYMPGGEVVQPTTSFPKAIKTTALDAKITQTTILDTYKAKVDSILVSHACIMNEIPVAPEDLKLSRSVEPADHTVRRMISEIEKTKKIADFDPIVVCERDGEFHVVSGNRRVFACQQNMLKKIYVSKIEPAASSDYLLTHFFLKHQDRDYDIEYSIEIISSLLDKIELTRKTLSEWTGRERNYVFSGLFGPMTKLRLLLDLLLEENLMRGVIRLSCNGFILSNHSLRDILRKHRQNPHDVTALLSKNLESDMELRKELGSIGVDLKHKLLKKKITEPAASELCKSEDLRKVRGDSQVQNVSCQFERFKAGSRKRPRASVATRVKLGVIEDDYDLLVTTNEASATRVISEKSSIVVILIGTNTSSGSESLLILPDSFGTIDDDGSRVFGSDSR
ncbi:unnamed protein product [Caenorhabditis brenneri]